jgi:hypothetical protein
MEKVICVAKDRFVHHQLGIIDAKQRFVCTDQQAFELASMGLVDYEKKPNPAVDLQVKQSSSQPVGQASHSSSSTTATANRRSSSSTTRGGSRRGRKSSTPATKNGGTNTTEE